VNDEQNFCWLAGLIEGEGSFMKAPPSRPNEPRLEIEMKDKDIIERVGALLGAKMQTRIRKTFDPPKTIYRVRLGGKRAVALMTRLKPYMGTRRQEQIRLALASYTARNERIAAEAHGWFTLGPVCTHPMCAQVPAPGARWCVTHRESGEEIGNAN
jgi:hypothetical protein